MLMMFRALQAFVIMAFVRQASLIATESEILAVRQILSRRLTTAALVVTIARGYRRSKLPSVPIAFVLFRSVRQVLAIAIAMSVMVAKRWVPALKGILSCD